MPPAQNADLEDTGHLGSLSTLGRGDLLAVLVVADTRGRSTVAAALAGADTRSTSVSGRLF